MNSFIDIVLNIFSSGLPCCLLALGIFLTFRLLDFADLTAEGSFLLGAALCAVMIFNGINPWLATLCSILIGFAAGLITGALNRYLKIPKLLSGIITMTAATSIALIIMGMQNGNNDFIASQVTFTSLIGKGTPQQTIYSLFYPWKTYWGVYIVDWPWGELVKVGVMLGVVIVAMVGIYFFFGTQYGMAIRATGMNEEMAKAEGINTNLSTLMCVGLSNALIALAGALYAQEATTVSLATSSGYLVVGLTSIIIGETVFGKRSFKNWIISVALGSIIYYIIITVAITLKLKTQLMSLVYAVLIVIALSMSLLKAKIQKKIKKHKDAKEDGGLNDARIS